MRGLIEFLKDRLDEDEGLARSADPGPWEVGPTFGARESRVYVRQQGVLIDTIGTCVFTGQVSNTPRYRANAAHVARHNPERTLREVEAKRAVLAEHEPFLQIVQWPHDQTGKGEAFTCPRCQNAANDSASWHPAEGQAGVFPYEPFVVAYVLAPCVTLRLLALPYADHADFQEEWRV